MAEYKHNHYVPIWYQVRFMLPGQHRYYRLDLTPEEVRRGNVKYKRHDVHHWSPRQIFAEDDLYTTRWSSISNREIEKFFSADSMKQRHPLWTFLLLSTIPT